MRSDGDLEASLADIEFLARSSHRVNVLDALAQDPFERSELSELTGASAPTMGRVLADLQERRWIDRDGPTYRLTHLGEFVADQFSTLCDAMTTERTLRDVWQWLPREMAGFSVDLFTDAVVSYPGPGYPYEPVERAAELIGNTRRMAGFGTAVIKSGSLETVCGAVMEGLELEYVFTPATFETTVAWDPEVIRETIACENCTVFVHDGLPDNDRCGLTIVDDRIAICCHDAETHTLQAVIDTGSPEAREWATAVHERACHEGTQIGPEHVAAITESTPSR
jgi:predicted transcriptional regulator